MMQKEKNDSVDILVLTYQRKKYIQEFIEQLYVRTDYPFRLLVIDNNSTDGTREWLLTMKESGLVHETIFLKENLPMASAFTEGMQHVKSDIFVVTQDDLLPPSSEPCWLTVLVKELENNSEFATISFMCKNSSWNKWIRRRKEAFINTLNSERKNRMLNVRKLIYEYEH